MKARTRFATGCGLVMLGLLGCASIERAGSDASAGAGHEPADGGASAVSGAGGSMAGQPAAGHGPQTGGSGAAAAGSGGASSVGGAGVSIAGGSPAGSSSDSGSAGVTEGGSAGMEATTGDAGAGGEAPVVLLENPSFEQGVLAPWQATVIPSDVGKAIYPQWGSGGVSIDGKFEVSFWNGSAPFTGDLHQTVSGLRPGKYQLKVYVAFGSGLNKAYLYAIGCGPSEVKVDLPIADTVPEFAPFSIPSIDVTEHSCTVGLFVDMNTGNWLNADAFELNPLHVP